MWLRSLVRAVLGLLPQLLTAVPEWVEAQPLGLGNDRAHPELRWMERQTEHFILVYHNGLEDLAVRAGTIAEQVYGPVLKGLEIEAMPRKTSIVLSEEDQIINGFALPGKMFLWVNVNDYIAYFGGQDKWLRQVIAHEFQHDVWFEAAQDWLGLPGLLRTPAWFIEGLAEYQTEEWGTNRSDLALRNRFLVDRHETLDPHDSGFSLVRYMAEQYGDSVIVHAVRKRNWLGLSDFAGGFKEKSGIRLKDFQEEWRRVAAAHTYALYAQKEEIAQVGEHIRSPAQGLTAMAFSPDGKRAATLARRSRRVLPSLALVQADTTGGWQQLHEIDHGFIDRDLGFSPDGRSLVYAKMHRSRHGSWLWDLKIADLETGRSRWITSGRRASHPHWSPAQDRIVYTAIDGSTTNLYSCDPAGGSIRQLTDHPLDVQALSPRFDPEGKRVAFVRFEAGSGVNLAVLDLEKQETRRLTQGPSHDMKPLWSRDGSQVFFTSDRNRDEVPNLFVVPDQGIASEVECLSDVGEALFGLDVDPASGNLIALGMASTDTVRLRSVPANRRARVVDPVIASRFVSWRDRVPPHPIPSIQLEDPAPMSPPKPYRALRHLRPMATLVLPSPNLWGITALTQFMDIAHTHRIVLGADVGTDNGSFGFRGFYGEWETNRLPFGLSGFLTLAGGLNSRAGLRIYGNDLLRDEQSPLRVHWRLPLNFGEHHYANHEVELFADFSQVEVQDRKDINRANLQSRGLPAPALDYSEHKLGIRYRSTKARPHARTYGHAHLGHGFLAALEWADEALGSDFDFRRLNLDASKLFGLPFLGRRIFVRARLQSVWGSAAPQDFTGLRADPPILPMGDPSTAVLGDFVATDETFFVRGFPRNVVGKRAFLGSVEWRLPLLPELPLRVFGFRPGGITGVLFYDQGRVWHSDWTLARHTVGWEIRVPLQFGSHILVVPSYGEGQTLAWERDGDPFQRDEYFKISMLQPF